MPPSQSDISEVYSGTMIADTLKLVAKIDCPPEPIFLLTQARLHLTDLRSGKHFQTPSRYPEMDDTDTAAYLLIELVQWCIERKQTEVCAICGQMRGMHSAANDLCRTEAGEPFTYFTPLTQCMYVYEANLPSGEGFQCANLCVVGSNCCARHTEEVDGSL